MPTIDIENLRVDPTVRPPNLRFGKGRPRTKRGEAGQGRTDASLIEITAEEYENRKSNICRICCKKGHYANSCPLTKKPVLPPHMPGPEMDMEDDDEEYKLVSMSDSEMEVDTDDEDSQDSKGAPSYSDLELLDKDVTPPPPPLEETAYTMPTPAARAEIPHREMTSAELVNESHLEETSYTPPPTLPRAAISIDSIIKPAIPKKPTKSRKRAAETDESVEPVAANALFTSMSAKHQRTQQQEPESIHIDPYRGAPRSHLPQPVYDPHLPQPQHHQQFQQHQQYQQQEVFPQMYTSAQIPNRVRSTEISQGSGHPSQVPSMDAQHYQSSISSHQQSYTTQYHVAGRAPHLNFSVQAPPYSAVHW